MIYLADADSKLPNLALMRLSSHFRARGERVLRITSKTRRTLFEHAPGDVYGSSIFEDSSVERVTIEREWGFVRWGGTGVKVESALSEIDPSVDWEAVPPDYSLYPGFTASVGFLTRGCRLRCGFCVVPRKEGRPRAVSSVDGVWRGDGHPRDLLLLDNDAFAAPLRDFWNEAHAELTRGGFRVCFSQGVNLRLIDDEAASKLASLHYTDNNFNKRILYTAWDNLRDEAIFRAGVARLERAGVPPHRLRVFMLVGYRDGETWEEVFYRFAEIVCLGAEPYVMVYRVAQARPGLAAFQRWANRYLWRTVAWPDYARESGYDARIPPEARAQSDAAWVRVVGRLLAS